eukprot:6025028-Heterocapsa_arctica.AAC.1
MSPPLLSKSWAVVRPQRTLGTEPPLDQDVSQERREAHVELLVDHGVGHVERDEVHQQPQDARVDCAVEELHAADVGKLLLRLLARLRLKALPAAIIFKDGKSPGPAEIQLHVTVEQLCEE